MFVLKVNNNTVVKLNSNGSVSPLAADADKPFGLAVIGNNGADERVTVLTPFVAIVNAPADGAITAGNTVQASVYANGVQKYKVGTTTPIGVALKSAADGADCQIGILRVPFKSF